MAEPNWAHNFSFARQPAHPSIEDAPDDCLVAPRSAKQLKLELNLAPPNPVVEESTQTRPRDPLPEPSQTPLIPLSEQEALLSELLQLRSLVHGQTERIQHLEQALDQSLNSIRDLQSQMVDQQLLEEQLAATEEIANIQQKAINQLKQQLAQQQQILDAQHAETQQRDQSLQDVLITMEDLTHSQQDELERLRTQISSDLAVGRAYQTKLENQLILLKQTTVVQQQRIVELEAQLHDRSPETHSSTTLLDQPDETLELTQQLEECQTAIHQLETELHRAHIALQEQQALIDSLQQPRSSNQRTTKESSLSTLQAKVEEFEQQLTRQNTTHAMLQHAYQEIEQERDRAQSRIAELEQQTADMQEQILKQAQQESEYETAVQHWKDRHLVGQHYLLAIKALLEKSSIKPPNEILELLQAATIIEATEPDISISPPPKSNRSVKLDLPDFLVRRQRYRTRP